MLGRLRKRFPVMIDGLAQGGWAGLYDVTPRSLLSTAFRESTVSFAPLVSAATASSSGPPQEKSSRSWRSMAAQLHTTYGHFGYTRFQEGKLSRGAYAYGIIG